MNPDSIDTSSEVERAIDAAVKALPLRWRRGAAQKDYERDDVRPLVLAAIAALSPSPVRPKEPPAVPPHWNGVGKYSIAFGFEPGGLNFRIAGHGRRDGTATLYFKDGDLDWDEEGYRVVEIANSELLEIRDKLNEVFPSPVREEAWQDLNTDDASPGKVLAILRYCAERWEPEARIIGNIRAGDIVRSLKTGSNGDG